MRHTPAEIKTIRVRLEARRQELLARCKDTLDRAESEIADASAELVDVANDQWDARVLSILSEHDALALENIVGALYRLDSGDYGVCTSCGSTVNEARLRVLPETSRCTACAARAERHEPSWSRHAS